MIRNKKAGVMLGGLELIAAFQAWQIWSTAFSYSSVDEFGQLLQSVTVLLSILVLVLPVTGLVFVFRNQRWGYLLLAAFPLLSIIFGITALPFVHYFYGKDAMLNSLFIAVINALVCAFAFWLFVSAKSHFPKGNNLHSSGEVK